jgi:hypothetical protein
MEVQKQKYQAKRNDNSRDQRQYEQPNLARGFFGSNRFSFTLIIQRHSEPLLLEMQPFDTIACFPVNKMSMRNCACGKPNAFQGKVERDESGGDPVSSDAAVVSRTRRPQARI